MTAIVHTRGYGKTGGRFSRLLCLGLLLCAQVSADGNYLQREQVQAYVDELVEQHRFERQFVVDIFDNAKPQTRVLEIIERPYEAQPWYIYRRQFLSSERVAEGLRFWRQNQALLAQIERQYQVPTEILLAIVGIETHYGKITGGFPVLDTLITLGFDYPRRDEFFRRELTELLLLGREEHLDFRNLQGSYAGAMGVGQFIPSSYRAYAVDFDQDRKRDLWGSLPDALASVANYLSRHGWVADGAVADRVELQGDVSGLQFNEQFKPSLSVAELKKYGVSSSPPVKDEKFALFSYQVDEDAAEHWVGYQNFYIITRYNRSRRYAMAVYQLSVMLADQYKSTAEKI